MLVTEEPVHPPLRLVPPYRSPCRCHPPGAGKPDAIRRGSMAHLPNSSRPALILPFWQPQDRGRLECPPFCAGHEGPHHPRSYARSGEGGAGIQGWPAPGFLSRQAPNWEQAAPSVVPALTVHEEHIAAPHLLIRPIDLRERESARLADVTVPRCLADKEACKLGLEGTVVMSCGCPRDRER